MTHSIPDTCHLFIQTPVGNFYHGSDFKIDLTPVFDEPPDFHEIARASGMGIKLLLSDGLGSEREGYTLSEAIVGKTFDEEMRVSKGRFFMTTFASNISRIKQCVEAAVKFNRKLCFVGRSMKRNMEIAFQNRYIKLNKDWVVSDEDVSRLPDNKICFILTGSQGESRSGMDKVALGIHRFIKLKKTDRVLFSSDPIPGNDTTIQDLQERIIEQGAEGIYTAIRDDLHASGHGSQGDLKLLARLVNAKNVMPIGTTIRHSKAYATLMKELGYSPENIFMLHDGQPLVFELMKIYSEDPIELKEMIVDGGSIGDVVETILKERATLGREGVILVAVNGEDVRIES
ncbi:MAG: ribonuclease J, partial [Patescibacteria group bacterium]